MGQFHAGNNPYVTDVAEPCDIHENSVALDNMIFALASAMLIAVATASSLDAYDSVPLRETAMRMAKAYPNKLLHLQSNLADQLEASLDGGIDIDVLSCLKDMLLKTDLLGICEGFDPKQVAIASKLKIQLLDSKPYGDDFGVVYEILPWLRAQMKMWRSYECSLDCQFRAYRRAIKALARILSVLEPHRETELQHITTQAVDFSKRARLLLLLCEPFPQSLDGRQRYVVRLRHLTAALFREFDALTVPEKEHVNDLFWEKREGEDLHQSICRGLINRINFVEIYKDQQAS